MWWLVLFIGVYADDSTYVTGQAAPDLWTLPRWWVLILVTSYVTVLVARRVTGRFDPPAQRGPSPRDSRAGDAEQDDPYARG